MAKYGSPSGVFVFDGYNLLAHKLQGIRVKIQANTEPTTGVGDSWEENCPVGVQMAELAQDGAFFMDGASSIHERLAGASGSPDSNPNGTPGVGIVGYAGSLPGAEVYAFNGVFAVSYEVVSVVNQLTRANAEYTVTGQVDNDAVLLDTARTTVAADGDTESASVDNSASSANGGRAYLVVDSLDLDGGTSFDVTVQDSPDDAVWSSLTAFTALTDVGSEVKAVSGTVERYLSVAWDFTGSPGTPSATFTVAFARD